MGKLDGFIIKIADKSWEFEAIEKLNYKTFVVEIPQHGPRPDKKLRDKFHAQNTYFICVNEGLKVLAGMIAYRDKRPFSLDEKMKNLEDYLPADSSVCEIRLFAIEKEYRYTKIAQRLIVQLLSYGKNRGHNIGIISGTTRQIKLYNFLGFVPFGPVVGSQGAEYQPMYFTYEAYTELLNRSRIFSKETSESNVDDTMLFNFLPGPVDLPEEVVKVLNNKPCSHRIESFINDFQEARKLLCELVNSQYVELMMGSGTLANDAIAGQLSLLSETGLVLVSGEFGHRLVRIAHGAKLKFHILEVTEGYAFQRAELEQLLDENSKISWIWGTHCETSTGVLNDIEMYKRVCRSRGIKLVMDCISSLGTIPIDLSDVYLASGTSGKGLASFAGLAMVFHNHALEASPNELPFILDLGYYQQHQGIPFTLQSNNVYALLAALKSQNWARRFEEINRWSDNVRQKLEEINVPIIANETVRMPSVVTIAVPESHSSETIGDSLKEKGVLISYNSTYLLKRNWIQICMMGAQHRSTDKFVTLLKGELRQ